MKKKKNREKVKRAHDKNPEKKKNRSKKYYEQNREILSKKAREKAREKLKDSDANLEKFKKAMEFGPEFVCVCCHRCLFEGQVFVFDKKLQAKIDPKILHSSCIFQKEFKDPQKKDNFYVCQNCLTLMKNKNKMPPSSVKNGLYVDEIPEALANLNLVERNMIARTIVFMKITKTPKTRMDKMIDRVVLVPVEPEDVMNSVESLPRGNQDSATVEVDFKRKKDLKNTHLSGYADPAKLFKSLATLKQLGHPGYQLVVKKCLFCPKEFNDEDKDILDHVENCSKKEKVVGENDRITESETKSRLEPKIKEMLSSIENEKPSEVYHTHSENIRKNISNCPDKEKLKDFKFLTSSSNPKVRATKEYQNRISMNIIFVEEILETKIFEPILTNAIAVLQESETYDEMFKTAFDTVEPHVFNDKNYEAHKQRIRKENHSHAKNFNLESEVRFSMQEEFEEVLLIMMDDTYKSRLEHDFHEELNRVSDEFQKNFMKNGNLEIFLKK